MGKREEIQSEIENIRKNISSRLEVFDAGNLRGSSDRKIINLMINDFEERFVTKKWLSKIVFIFI
jgi:hypothetical protein